MTTERRAATKTRSRGVRRAAQQGKAESNQACPSDVSSLDNPRLYVNRELSLLAFQKRVFEEAQDEQNPLLERVKFLSILGSNLDEFFMVRVAGLKRQVESGVLDCGPDGMTPKQQLSTVHQEVLELLKAAQDYLRQELFPALEKAGICVVDYSQLTPVQRSNADKFFSNAVFPTLTPLAFDPGRPFPHISNLSLNLAVLLEDDEGTQLFARLKVPDSLPQFVPVNPAVSEAMAWEKKASPPQYMVWLEQLIAANLESLFPGMKIIASYPFHVTRDADSAIQDLEAGDLMESIEEGVWQRRFADVIRLEVNDAMPADVLEILQKNLELDPEDVYTLGRPLALSRLKHLAAVDHPELKYKPFVPAIPAALRHEEEEEDLFAAIQRQDILLLHPFDSFQPVVTFLQRAAHDPAVLAIKMTLYRVGRNSPVVEALLDAVREGKEVAVLVELKARFDEESNIEWARALEHEGAHVVYGLLDLKVHCKTALVVRREGDAIRRYMHLSTGNYNAVTAQLYTDIGMFTSDEAIGGDCTDLFNYLTGYSAKVDYQKLFVAPVNLRGHFEQLIQREIEHQRSGERGHLIFKMNALVDARMIQLLYQASQAGVQVDLLVRGICCLRPGIAGVSQNIKVTSIIGRFLEHSRIFYFRNAGQEEIYLGSADIMPRNLDRRVEVAFPVRDPALRRFLRDEVLAIYLADVVNARHMKSDGTYDRPSNRNHPDSMNCQEWFIRKIAAVGEMHPRRSFQEGEPMIARKIT
jgi:polyphosphate kinase